MHHKQFILDDFFTCHRCKPRSHFSRVARRSRGAFCLRMLRRKYFDVSNRWYAPALRGRKSQNGGSFNKFFGGVFPS